MNAYIKTEPCCSCDASKAETETGALYCAYGDFDACEFWRQAEDLADIAGQVADKFRHISDDSIRRELATGTADAFANALFMQGKGAEFDIDAFLTACDVRQYAGERR